jgi:hypothetical protein
LYLVEVKYNIKLAYIFEASVQCFDKNCKQKAQIRDDKMSLFRQKEAAVTHHEKFGSYTELIDTEAC